MNIIEGLAYGTRQKVYLMGHNRRSSLWDLKIQLMGHFVKSNLWGTSLGSDYGTSLEKEDTRENIQKED